MKAKRKTRPTAGDVLAATGVSRRNNLRKLIGGRFDMQADLASVLGVTDSYLSQLLGPNPIRRVSEPTARKFEYRLGMRAGELDRGAVE